MQGHARDEAMRHNRDAFARLAAVKEKDQSRLLLKVVGGLDHGGEDVLKPDSTGYRILAEFVRRVNAPPSDDAAPVVDDKNLPPFFDGVVDAGRPKRLLRRVTLSLAGRLPTDAELAAVADKGLEGAAGAPRRADEGGRLLRPAPRRVQRHLPHARHRRQRGPTVLSYEHFEKTRTVDQKHDLSHIKDEKERQQGRLQARRRLPQGAARRADEADRAHRPQRSAVHRDRHGRLHHGHALHGPRLRHLRRGEGASSRTPTTRSSTSRSSSRP